MDEGAVRASAGLSLLFAAGERPDAGTIRQALGRCQIPVHVARETTGLTELVVDGLTFDLAGAAPGEPALAPTAEDSFGFGSAPEFAGLEAVGLYPGPHLSGGLAMTPVVRAMLALAAELAVCLPARAVIWHPAATALEPAYFSRVVLAWLAGGAFPALALTALAPGVGGMASRGLAHFVGQEVVVEARPGETAEETLGLATRVIDRIVSTGPLQETAEFSIAGQVVCAEPVKHGGCVLIWRK